MAAANESAAVIHGIRVDTTPSPRGGSYTNQEVLVGGIWQQFQQLIFQALLYRGHHRRLGNGDHSPHACHPRPSASADWKQTKSMVEMQRVQPQLKALQVKYKDDKEKLQEET